MKNDSQINTDKIFYLKNPAIIRKPMKRVKPDQTPASPNTDGANNKNAEDIAPTTICKKNNVDFKNEHKLKPHLMPTSRKMHHTIDHAEYAKSETP